MARFGHIRTALLSQLASASRTPRRDKNRRTWKKRSREGPQRPKSRPSREGLEFALRPGAAAQRHVRRTADGGPLEQRGRRMSTQRFDDVGVRQAASPAERAVKDSAPRISALARRSGGKRTVRSAPRQGFLRRRLHRRHQGPQVAQDRRGRARDPVQPRASRRGRRRPARRRRRRHSGADPAPVLRAQGGRTRHHAAGARATTRSASCSCRTIRNGGRSFRRSLPRRSRRKA